MGNAFEPKTYWCRSYTQKATLNLLIGFAATSAATPERLCRSQWPPGGGVN